MENTKKISIVIPVYNEAENIAALYREIRGVCEHEGYVYEIIIVDDGSTDQTAKVCTGLLPVKLVSFRKNYGQTAALDAGIKQAQYDLIATMDGDGQNDPADIPDMIKMLEEKNFDVVSGWRKNRNDGFSKRFISRGADWLRKFLINDRIHDSGCTLKVYRKICFEGVNLYGEIHRFIPALLDTKGFKIGEMVVNHRPRHAGETKYNWNRILKGLIDLISVWFWGKFAVRPLHLLGGIGIFLTLIGVISSFVTFLIFISGGDLSGTVWPLLSVFFLIMGIQLFILGLIADMVMKNYYENTGKLKPYSIKEVTENK